MRYYVIADPHGFYTKMHETLTEKGFFDDRDEHKLILLGDLFDRGKEAVEMQKFVCELTEAGQLIYIRGNHEDLMCDMLDNFSKYRMEIYSGFCHHVSNGTLDTALQLTGFSKYDALIFGTDFVRKMRETPFIKTLIHTTVDYFETEEYVFVHGWIPLFPESKKHLIRRSLSVRKADNGESVDESPLPDWRNADIDEWNAARWLNGMETAVKCRLTEPSGKTVVCGHWHTSYGHAVLEGKGSEFEEDADFSPFYGEGVIGLDACTSYSGKMNCLVIDDSIHATV